MALYRCRTCDAVIGEKDFSEISFDGRKYSVCPECLAELLNADYETISPEEEAEYRREWAGDDEYQRRKEGLGDKEKMRGLRPVRM